MWMEHSKDGLQDKPRKANDHTMDETRYACMWVDAMFGVLDEVSVIYADDSPVGAWWPH